MKFLVQDIFKNSCELNWTISAKAKFLPPGSTIQPQGFALSAQLSLEQRLSACPTPHRPAPLRCISGVTFSSWINETAAGIRLRCAASIRKAAQCQPNSCSPEYSCCCGGGGPRGEDFLQPWEGSIPASLAPSRLARTSQPSGAAPTLPRCPLHTQLRPTHPTPLPHAWSVGCLKTQQNECLQISKFSPLGLAAAWTCSSSAACTYHKTITAIHRKKQFWITSFAGHYP